MLVVISVHPVACRVGAVAGSDAGQSDLWSAGWWLRRSARLWGWWLARQLGRGRAGDLDSGGDRGSGSDRVGVSDGNGDIDGDVDNDAEDDMDGIPDGDA